MILFQLSGLEDLYVFNGGQVKIETTTLIGNATGPGQIALNSLHVQSKGYFQIKTMENENDVFMSLKNFTVSFQLNIYTFSSTPLLTLSYLGDQTKHLELSDNKASQSHLRLP